MLSGCVMWWRLIIEEYGPQIFYIPGPNNAVADALRRLTMMDEMPTKNSLPNDVLKKYARTKDINDARPLDTGVLVAAQWNKFSVPTSDLKRIVREDKDYFLYYVWHTRNNFVQEESLCATALT